KVLHRLLDLGHPASQVLVLRAHGAQGLLGALEADQAAPQFVDGPMRLVEFVAQGRFRLRGAALGASGPLAAHAFIPRPERADALRARPAACRRSTAR